MSRMSCLDFVVSLVEGASSPLSLACVRGWGEWNQLAVVLHQNVVDGEGSCIALFATAVERCSESTFIAECKKWTTTLSQILAQSSSRILLQCTACRALCVVLKRASSCSASRDYIVHSLPLALATLSRLSQSTPDVQATALSAISRIIVSFPSQVGQYKGVFKAWATAGLLSSHTHLAQESARCLVLLQSTEQWLALALEALACLEKTLLELLGPALGNLPLPSPPQSQLLPLSLTPELEPERSSSLLLTLTALCRVLCYAGQLTTKGSVQFPVVRWLAVVGLGLAVQPQQIITESTEGMLLCALVPSIHTAMWSLVQTLIVSCSDHLLPFTAVIEEWFVQSFVFQRSANHSCSQLKLAVHKALECWVSVRRDCDDQTISAIVQWLLEDITSGPPDVKLSSARTLHCLVRYIGLLLPITTAQSLLKTIVELLTGPSVDCDNGVTNVLLEVLVDCILSGASSLTPPLSVVLDILGHHRLQPMFAATCQQGIAVCALLQHPSVPPSLVTPPPPSLHPPPSSLHPSPPLSKYCSLSSPNEQPLNLSAQNRSVGQQQINHMPRAPSDQISSLYTSIAGGAAPNTPIDTQGKNIPSPPMEHENSLHDHSQNSGDHSLSSNDQEETRQLMDIQCGVSIVTSSCDRCEPAADSDKELLATFVDEPPDN